MTRCRPIVRRRIIRSACASRITRDLPTFLPQLSTGRRITSKVTPRVHRRARLNHPRRRRTTAPRSTTRRRRRSRPRSSPRTHKTAARLSYALCADIIRALIIYNAPAVGGRFFRRFVAEPIAEVGFQPDATRGDARRHDICSFFRRALRNRLWARFPSSLKSLAFSLAPPINCARETLR